MRTEIIGFLGTYVRLVVIVICSGLEIFGGSNNFYSDCARNADTDFPQMTPRVADKFYQMLKVIDEVFIKHDIPYWINSGTAWSAVRHGGIIPWDDDADVEIFEHDARKVLAVQYEFEKYGLIIKHYEQLIHQKAPILPTEPNGGRSRTSG